jgi:hypothetical protein
MNFTAYLNYFQEIIEDKADNLPELYQNPEYLEYTKLNWSRMNRWLKTGILLEQTIAKLKSISSPQNWIVITEPWCGDASHIVPFIELMARENDLISVSYELRDAAPFRIDDYLTNGGKSIPILIIQDQNQKDIAVWGPRPKECQELYLREKDSGFENVKIALQKWYNQDKGISIQNEISNLL